MIILCSYRMIIEDGGSVPILFYLLAINSNRVHTIELTITFIQLIPYKIICETIRMMVDSLYVLI